MASTSRRSLRERVLAVFGGKRPARHSYSSFNDLQREQRMDETGYPVPAAPPNSNFQSATLPSTSRPMRLTGLDSEQVQLIGRDKPQKSNSLGSVQHCTLSTNMRPLGRCQETLLAYSELDRFPQMQIPTTESKNSSVRYKTKKLGVNISVPNVSTEENYSQMDTLCSEANRSSQVFDSSAGIFDGNSESTTPLTSGQSSKDVVENGADLSFGAWHESPARKTSCDRRSIGIETDAVCDQEDDSYKERRDLQLSHGAKSIIETADAVIKIFDGSLSIKGRFKEVVIKMNVKKVRRNNVVDVATSTDACPTQHDSSLPQPVANFDHNCFDVGVATPLSESCGTSDRPEGQIYETPSVQSELRRLKYKLLNSDDDDESVLECNKSGLTIAGQCINVSLPTVRDNVSGIHPSIATGSGASKSADASAIHDVGDNTVIIATKDIHCRYNTPSTDCDNCIVSMPDAIGNDNEHSQARKYERYCENPCVGVHSRDSDVPPEYISRLKTSLPSTSTESQMFAPSCAQHVDNADPNIHSIGHLLGTINGPGNEQDSVDNADRIRSGYSEIDNCDGTTNCEGTSQLLMNYPAHPGVTREGSHQGQESVAVGDRKMAECEGHSECLDLDDCEISAAADSSTIVDGCSPDSHHADQHEGTDDLAVDMKMVLHQDGSGSSGGSLADECGLVDVYKLTQQVAYQTGKLNKLIDKYRSRALKIERLQKYLDQLNKEKEEMCRLLQGVNKETAALRLEAAELRCTVSAVCDTSVTAIGKETEARRLEPTCYRRYTNIRTAADASNALAAVRCRIKALNELEVLVYRKQLMLNHILPSLHQDAVQPTKPALLSSKTSKSKKSEQRSCTRGSRNNVVIEVLSEPNSWSELHTYTDSAVTLSTALTTSNDGTASVGPITGTDV